MTRRGFFTFGHYFSLALLYVGVNFLFAQRWFFAASYLVLGAANYYAHGASLERLNDKERREEAALMHAHEKTQTLYEMESIFGRSTSRLTTESKEGGG